MSQRYKVILDTDIGDDIDDAFALGLILRSPELELLGVTTVFGHVEARSRQARTLLALAGRTDIPVCAGCGGSLSSRNGDARRRYLDGQLPRQDPASWPEAELAPQDRRHAVPFLIETIMAGDGDIVPITIGPLTNLAAALALEPRLAGKIPRVVAMAAEVRHNMAEWNIVCDPEAAALVLSSGIPIDVTTWHIGHVATLAPEHMATLREATNPLAQQLWRTLGLWQEAPGKRPSLYDPLAVATLIQPEWCDWRQGRVEVELSGAATYGYTSFVEDPAGPHRVAWDVRPAPALDFILRRLTGDDGQT